MNEVHDVQPGHIYQPGNKKEVRLVYRILSGPYCGRHQKSFSLTKWGVAGAWDAAQQAKAYMLQTGRLPPSFASPYSRSKLTNASANAIVKPVRPPGVPGVEGFLGPMDLDGSGASALFPSLAAFSATTKPPDAALGNSLHTRTQPHGFHCEDKSYTKKSPATEDALRFRLEGECTSMSTSQCKGRAQRATSGAAQSPVNLRHRQHSVGTSSSTTSAPLSPLGTSSDSAPSSSSLIDTLHTESAVAVAAQLLSPLLASLCKVESQIGSGDYDDTHANFEPNDRNGSTSPYGGLPVKGAAMKGAMPKRHSSGTKGTMSTTKHTGKDCTSDTEETVSSLSGSDSFRKLLLPASLRVSSPGLSAFSDNAGAPFPFLPSPQTGYQRAAPGWAYPPAVQATLEATARVAAGPSGPSCFQGQGAGPAGGPSVACGNPVPSDLLNLQMLSGTVPHFATLQGDGNGAGPWVESPTVPVGANGGTEGNVSPATAAATALTLLQLAEQNAALQRKDQNQIEPNALQKFLLLQQFQLLQEKGSHQNRICRKSGESPCVEAQGNPEENSLATASRSTHASAGDLSEVHHLSDEGSTAGAHGCTRSQLTLSNMPTSANHRETDTDENPSRLKKCISPDEENEESARLKLTQNAGPIFSSPLLPQGPRGGELQGQATNEDIDAVNMSDTLRNLLAASLQRQQELAGGSAASQQNGGDGSVAPHAHEHSESFFNLRSLASLLPQQSGMGKPEQKRVSDGRGNPSQSSVTRPREAAQDREAAQGVPSHLAMFWRLSSLDAACKKSSGRGPIGASPVSLEGDSGPLSVASEPTTTSLNSVPDSLVALGRDSLLADSDREDVAGECSTRTSGDASDHPSAMKLLSPISLPGHPSPFGGAQSPDALCLPSEGVDAVPCDLGSSRLDVLGNEEIPSSSGVATRSHGRSSPRNPPRDYLHEQMCPNTLDAQDALRRGLPSNGNRTDLLRDLPGGRAADSCLGGVQGDTEGAALALLEAQGCLTGRGGEGRATFPLHQAPENLQSDILHDREMGERGHRKRKGRLDSPGEIWEGDTKRGRMFCGIATSSVPASAGSAVSAERDAMRALSEIGDRTKWLQDSVHSACASEENVGSRRAFSSFAPV
ncbi:unnamed protein product [Neospora caninum Liverpool]|uniref:AP2 domain transcription factor AP2VIII-5 n=1 Tax=Neospora caninum (strain Liverpool) TaxID=572307 RepID=F0VJ73_NEOCL|nr:uncharacterized protein NCLIV_035650 [Neospora caninum Liverpool]CBZ53784.1 unnamed protein product [Neospora caninum Liverpool]CEL67777.1 TPA: AP2 domain transcription factor AP2VIII-5 [Neospora caninum Liverpool]|eukprot:XP_003883816.1 uncharacterized protein NCLIV_035650 [Neospora caninum Liverpool]